MTKIEKQETTPPTFANGIRPQDVNVQLEHINRFFDYYGAEDCRNHLWDLFKAAVSGGYADWDVVRKENLISFYEELDRLLEELAFMPEEV